MLFLLSSLYLVINKVKVKMLNSYNVIYYIKHYKDAIIFILNLRIIYITQLWIIKIYLF